MKQIILIDLACEFCGTQFSQKEEAVRLVRGTVFNKGKHEDVEFDENKTIGYICNSCIEKRIIPNCKGV